MVGRVSGPLVNPSRYATHRICLTHYRPVKRAADRGAPLGAGAVRLGGSVSTATQRTHTAKRTHNASASRGKQAQRLRNTQRHTAIHTAQEDHSRNARLADNNVWPHRTVVFRC